MNDNITLRLQLLGQLFSHKNLLAWGVLALALGATLLAWDSLRQSQSASASRQLELLADEISEAIIQRMHNQESILLGGAALLDANKEVSRDDWRTYARRLNLEERYPGIQGLGFSQVLPAEQLHAFETEMRAEGYPNFRVRPLGERTLYSAIRYIEPFTRRNLVAFGFDMLSEPVRQAAMLSAARSGQSRLSGRVTLVQETNGKLPNRVCCCSPRCTGTTNRWTLPSSASPRCVALSTAPTARTT